MPAVVFYEYLVWQYSEGVREVLRAWLNIHWFLWRVFSVPLLLRTFFAPFRRTNESYGRSFDPEALAETFVVNLVTRLVGAVVKAVLLAAALLFQAIAGMAGGVLLVLFLTAPFIIPLSVLAAVIVMFI